MNQVGARLCGRPVLAARTLTGSCCMLTAPRGRVRWLPSLTRSYWLISSNPGPGHSVPGVYSVLPDMLRPSASILSRPFLPLRHVPPAVVIHFDVHAGCASWTPRSCTHWTWLQLCRHALRKPLGRCVHACRALAAHRGMHGPPNVHVSCERKTLCAWVRPSKNETYIYVYIVGNEEQEIRSMNAGVAAAP